MTASRAVEPASDVLPTVETHRHAPRMGGQRHRAWRALFDTPLALAGVVIFAGIALAAVFAPLLARFAPIDMVGPLSAAPSGTHWFGTNNVGQDIFAQTVYGARFSLAVGVAAGVAITVIAALAGLAAGYIGGWMDDLLSTVMNVFLVVPQLPLLVVIAAYVPNRGGGPVTTAITMVLVITITGWAWGARVIRSQTLTLRHRDFVKAALVAGEPRRRIIVAEIMPNMISLLANTVIMSTLGSILAEAALDYLGVGSVSQVTWGTMLNHAQQTSTLFAGQWWCFVFPGLAIALSALSLILMNYAVDVISNPWLRSVRAAPSSPAAFTAGMQPAEATS